MALPTGDILTNLLIEFKNKLDPATSILLPHAQATLYILMTIDLVLAYIISLIKEEDAGYKLLFINTLKYGAFIFLVTSYKDIINAIVQSFQIIGLKAAGDIISINEFTNPSKLSEKGLELTSNLMVSAGSGAKMLNPFTAIMLLIASIAIIIAFMVMGIQIFIVTVEFYIVAALGLILVPFGVFRHTSFLYEKVKEGIINFGIKYMVLGFVVSVSMSIIQKWTPLSEGATFDQALYMAFGACALAYLCHHAPSVASGMQSGGGGTLGGMAMMGAMAGVAGTMKRHAGTGHDGFRGYKDPNTGERIGGFTGRGGTIDSIRGIKNQQGIRQGGLTGEGGFVDRLTGMDDKQQQMNADQKRKNDVSVAAEGFEKFSDTEKGKKFFGEAIQGLPTNSNQSATDTLKPSNNQNNNQNTDLIKQTSGMSNLHNSTSATLNTDSTFEEPQQQPPPLPENNGETVSTQQQPPPLPTEATTTQATSTQQSNNNAAKQKYEQQKPEIKSPAGTNTINRQGNAENIQKEIKDGIKTEYKRGVGGTYE